MVKLNIFQRLFGAKPENNDEQPKPAANKTMRVRQTPDTARPQPQPTPTAKNRLKIHQQPTHQPMPLVHVANQNQNPPPMTPALINDTPFPPDGKAKAIWEKVMGYRESDIRISKVETTRAFARENDNLSYILNRMPTYANEAPETALLLTKMLQSPLFYDEYRDVPDAPGMIQSLAAQYPEIKPVVGITPPKPKNGVMTFKELQNTIVGQEKQLWQDIVKNDKEIKQLEKDVKEGKKDAAKIAPDIKRLKNEIGAYRAGQDLIDNNTTLGIAVFQFPETALEMMKTGLFHDNKIHTTHKIRTADHTISIAAFIEKAANSNTPSADVYKQMRKYIPANPLTAVKQKQP